MEFKVDVVFPVGRFAAPATSGPLAMALAPEAESEWLPQDLLERGGLDWAHFGDAQVVDLISATQELVARAQAAQLGAVAELRARRGDDRDTGDEVAYALSVSAHAADRQVLLANSVSRNLWKFGPVYLFRYLR